ncbi:RlmE family RNA methyltransferase [Alphaproteobacteria bacterium]|jgi:23S rRNA (uridine2552-2'-O)-methyltransferase|nr:RlmE family RNA methyltransferase [Alphaproteobacteria bacterium]
MTGNKGAGGDGGGPKKGPSGRSYRGKTGLTRQPKKMRGRKVSSQRWLTRQLNDPFVAEARSRGFRSRAALKLEQIDDRYDLLKSGMAIVDLGCAPGGWMQVASMRTKLGKGNARLVGIDLLETENIVDADIFVGDMMDDAMLTKVRDAIGGAADGVVSDMAAATTGHRATDHLRTTALLEAALDFALEVLNKNGFFLAKCFRGGAERHVLDLMQQNFTTVRHVKPAASRQESVESYVLATGYHGDGQKLLAAEEETDKSTRDEISD